MSYQKSMGNLLGSIAFLISAAVFFVIFFFSDVSVFASVLAGSFILGGIGAVIISIRELVLIHTIMKNGKRITTKICGHMDDKTESRNGVYDLKLLLKYYDDFYVMIQREVDTGISKNERKAYPIGHAVDIIEYGEKFVLLPDTVREEYIPGEEKFFENLKS